MREFNQPDLETDSYHCHITFPTHKERDRDGYFNILVGMLSVVCSDDNVFRKENEPDRDENLPI